MKTLPDGRVEFEMTMSRIACESTTRIENGFLVMGGRSVETFPNGRQEIREFDNCKVGWTDGSPFTEADKRRFQ